MARAMATRCCSPPDSCDGKWSMPVAQADQPQRSSGRIGSRGDLGDQGDVLAGGQAGDQVVELEDEADVLAAVARQGGVVGGGQVVVAVADGAAGGHVQAAEDVEQRRFAAAGRPEQDDELALVQVEVDAAQGVDLDLAHAVDLGDPAGLEDGRAEAFGRSSEPHRRRPLPLGHNQSTQPAIPISRLTLEKYYPNQRLRETVLRFARAIRLFLRKGGPASAAGSVTLPADSFQFGPNLNVKLDLFDGNGNLVAGGSVTSRPANRAKSSPLTRCATRRMRRMKCSLSG